MAYYVYILECSNGAFYTGYTDNVEKRYQEHSLGKGAKYTRSFKPIKIAQVWNFESKSQAMTAESMIKRLPRKAKEEIVRNPELLGMTEYTI